MTEPRSIRVVIDEMLDHVETHWQRRTTCRAQNSAPIAMFERSLEVISEASRLLPTDLKESKADIPWRKIADFGNVLRHAYFAVDPDIVWRIVRDDLIPLRRALLTLRQSLD